MNKEEFLKHRKEMLLYSLTITCLIVGVLFRTNKLFIASDKVIAALSAVFILASYMLLLKIGADLNKKDIRGVQTIAWAAFLLYTKSIAVEENSALWVAIIDAISTFGAIFFLTFGSLQFVFSLINKIKAMDKKESKMIESMETVVAIVTSIAAIIISIIAL